MGQSLEAEFEPERLEGRYELFEEIAIGGMATVQLGRLTGAGGFAKSVAVKRLHRHLVGDPDFISMFLDEARLAARIRHPNVVSTLDVVQRENEVFLVLDYVEGEALSKLLVAASKRNEPIPPRIVASIMVGSLYGLHAAHEATDENGDNLGIVHRDVSPQNIMVGVDGVARVLDFGIAKGAGRIQTTREGQVKGKLRYMSPEQIHGEEIDHRADIYAAAVVVWESLTGRKLIDGPNQAAVMNRIVEEPVTPLSELNPDLADFDAVVLKGLEKKVDDRYGSAREMARELEAVRGLAPAYEVGEWVASLCGEALAERAAKVRRMEQSESTWSGMRPIPRREEATEPEATEPPAVESAPLPESTQQPERGGKLTAVVAVLVVLLLGGGAALLFVPGTEQPHEPGAAPAEPARAPAPAATTAEQTEPEPTAAATSDDEAEPAEPSTNDTADAPPEPKPVAAPPRTAPRPAATKSDPPPKPTGTEEPAKPAPKPSRKAVDCAANPLFVDSSGIKRVRPECM